VSGLLDHEQEQRRLLVDQHLGLTDKETEDARTRVEEHAELSAVEDRDPSVLIPQDPTTGVRPG
jgi:hypothetical protein